MRDSRNAGRDDALAVAVIGGVTALTAIGSSASSDYDSWWFRSLRKPSWEPSGGVIGAVWSVLYLCTASAGVLLWRKRKEHYLPPLAWLFYAQYVLNYAFTPLLTKRRSLPLSTLDAVALHLVVNAIVALAWPIRRTAALLMLPYSAWTLFASVLSWRVWRLNRASPVT